MLIHYFYGIFKLWVFQSKINGSLIAKSPGQNLALHLVLSLVSYSLEQFLRFSLTFMTLTPLKIIRTDCYLIDPFIPLLIRNLSRWLPPTVLTRYWHFHLMVWHVFCMQCHLLPLCPWKCMIPFCFASPLPSVFVLLLLMSLMIQILLRVSFIFSLLSSSLPKLYWKSVFLCLSFTSVVCSQVCLSLIIFHTLL